MRFFLPLLLFSLITFHLSLSPIQARTTPQETVDQQKADFDQRTKNYSPQNKQKLLDYQQKIADLNKKITDDWEKNLFRQGQILEEYTSRKKINLAMGSKDGINRNLQDPIQNAQYWLNFAHEAVAYQASQKYLITPTAESSINSNITSKISSLQSDLTGLKAKVLKSQQIIASLVSK
jgi:hypothetical protein